MGVRSYFPSRLDSVIERDGDNLLLFDTRSGSLFEANEVGRRIWQMCDGRNSLNSIATALCDGSRRNATEIENGVHKFVGRLVALNLIQISHKKRSGKVGHIQVKSGLADTYRTPKIRKIWSDRAAVSGFLLEI